MKISKRYLRINGIISIAFGIAAEFLTKHPSPMITAGLVMLGLYLSWEDES